MGLITEAAALVSGPGTTVCSVSHRLMYRHTGSPKDHAVCFLTRNSNI